MKKRHKTIRKWPIEKTGAKNVPSLLSESLKQATSRPKRNHIKWVVLGEGGGNVWDGTRKTVCDEVLSIRKAGFD